jgi:hypothetical protein
MAIEPIYSGQENFYDDNPEYQVASFSIELSLLIIFLMDLVMELYHRKFDLTRSFQDKYLKNLKLVSKFVIIIICLIDFITFYCMLPRVIFRFSKPLRPCNCKINFLNLIVCLALYQKQLRRTVTGIIRSLGSMIDIVIFLMGIMVVYAVIGLRVIGDLEGDTPYDEVSRIVLMIF